MLATNAFGSVLAQFIRELWNETMEAFGDVLANEPSAVPKNAVQGAVLQQVFDDTEAFFVSNDNDDARFDKSTWPLGAYYRVRQTVERLVVFSNASSAELVGQFYSIQAATGADTDLTSGPAVLVVVETKPRPLSLFVKVAEIRRFPVTAKPVAQAKLFPVGLRRGQQNVRLTRYRIKKGAAKVIF